MEKVKAMICFHVLNNLHVESVLRQYMHEVRNPGRLIKAVLRQSMHHAEYEGRMVRTSVGLTAHC